MHQPKDTDWLSGYENKIHTYAVNKRPTSNLGTYTDYNRGWKMVFHAYGNQKKAGAVILVSDKNRL